MRGAALDGDWSRLDAQGRLVPALSLKRRFDHLLTLQGELSLEQLQAWIEQAVVAEHGAAQAQEVLVQWQRYLALLRHPFQSRVDPTQPQSWAVALAEREGVRQRVLGLPWAEAFYGDEHRAMREAAQAPAGTAASATHASTTNAAGIDVLALDAAARERLAAEQQAWADWERRLGLARQEWQRLRNALELSELQREAAFEQWLASQFSAGETRRVRALLR
jgi:lipase chaperone LimK